MNNYMRFLRPQALATLTKMRAELGDNLNGTTPDPDMTVLASVLVASQARRVLQLGTFLGYSSVVLADIIAAANHDWRFVSVDPNPQYQAVSEKYTKSAGLDKCEYWTGASQDPAIVARAALEQWDCIYIDTTHQYQQTVTELGLYAPLAIPQTVMLFHDASTHAQTLDLGGAGGVKRALTEFLAAHPDWQGMTFERPMFRGLFGVGVLTRKV